MQKFLRFYPHDQSPTRPAITAKTHVTPKSADHASPSTASQREIDTLQARIRELEHEQAVPRAEFADVNLYDKDPARATALSSRDADIEEEMLTALTRCETLSGE